MKIIEVSGIFGCIDLPLIFELESTENSHQLEGPSSMRIAIKDLNPKSKTFGEVLRIEKQSTNSIREKLADKHFKD